MPLLSAGYVGDYAEDFATLNFKFSTFTTAWVPVALASGVIKVYEGSATGTEVTTGITLAADFDGVVGLNNVLIDLSSAAFYATGADYHVVITTGTIDSVSAVGTVVASFSIENRSGDVNEAYAEPSSVPAATSSLKDKIGWLFTLSRNKGTQTSTTKTLRNDADDGTIASSTISDDATTFTRGEWT